MSEQKESNDVVLVHSPTEDGAGARVIRMRPERIEVGEVRPVREGQPLVGEVVRLKPRAESPALCDVEVLYKGPTMGDKPASPPAMQKAPGPAQVATQAYRDNWEQIFAARLPASEPN